jgi:hypothetical protein
MASRAGRQPSPTTDPLPAERRGRASDGAQNRPPRQPPGQGPRRREPGDAVGTAGGRSVPAGCGHRRPGPMHVRPPTPGALLLAREPHAGRRPPPVCISWRGDAPRTHTSPDLRLPSRALVGLLLRLGRFLSKLTVPAEAGSAGPAPCDVTTETSDWSNQALASSRSRRNLRPKSCSRPAVARCGHGVATGAGRPGRHSIRARWRGSPRSGRSRDAAGPVRA